VEDADYRAQGLLSDSCYVITSALAAKEPEKPEQADSDCEHACRDGKDGEHNTPDARRNAGRHHRTCPSGRWPGADRMAAWNSPEAPFVFMHRSHRPLIGVTGRVSVGPTCWPQAGPNATSLSSSPVELA
jgi:hypothetical protein